ncbi:MAG: aldo/keto reductase, partial [Nitriliruptorales bacterium]
IAALQTEYSLMSREPEETLLSTCRELGTAFVAYSPLGIGLLTGTVTNADDLPPGNRLARQSRMDAQNLGRNLAVVERLRELAAEAGCSMAQLALAWVLARGVAAIPGSARIEHLRENLRARDIELSAALLSRIDAAAPPGAFAGERKSTLGLRLVGR